MKIDAAEKAGRFRPSDAELLERAAAQCHRFITSDEPSRALSSVEGDLVILRNVLGELARYRYHLGSLRRAA
jgi:hypothetical protein